MAAGCSVCAGTWGWAGQEGPASAGLFNSEQADLYVAELMGFSKLDGLTWGIHVLLGVRRKLQEACCSD